MPRRRVILTLVVYFFATIVAAPIAFQIGAARGGRLVASADFAGGDAPSASATATSFECASFVGFPGIRQFDRIQDCRPPSKDTGWRAPSAAVATGKSRRNGPLARAAVAAIARGSANGGDGGLNGGLNGSAEAGAGGAPGAGGPFSGAFGGPFSGPFSLALAPDGAGGKAGGPTIPGGGGLPGYLIANGLAAPSGPDAAPLETPIPGALPLLLTGLIALFGARKARSHSS